MDARRGLETQLERTVGEKTEMVREIEEFSLPLRPCCCCVLAVAASSSSSRPRRRRVLATAASTIVSLSPHRRRGKVLVPKPWASAGITIANNCSYPVWPGIQSSPKYPVVARGGFFLPPNTEQWVDFPEIWSGSIWGRLGCNFDVAGRGKCVTGDCGNGLYCNGLSGAPPATILRLSMQLDQELYNVPITIKSFTGPDDSKCGIVGCTKDLNTVCPAALQVRSRDNKSVVACKSPCGNAKTCGPNQYSKIFKKYCPKAYTYTFDKTPSSVVPCANVGYVITFCPTKKMKVNLVINI
ncbi:thaumatin-like protein [Vigna angularis]|uniref:thaumatin-like protein n=1 Tax=Phaseolus angularis TaxID=3914 RepID=UPI0022B35F0F|nr:thaumatin-like protein [Vigna angularis]